MCETTNESANGSGYESGSEPANEVASEVMNESTGEVVDEAVGDEAEEASALLERIAALEAQLSQAHEALDASERQRAIDLALIESDAVDVETARLLTEIAVTQMDEPDVALAVSELKLRKPFLFRRGRSGGVSAMGALGPVDHAGSVNGLEEAAEAAMASGDRSSLLTYLRMRRAGEA